MNGCESIQLLQVFLKMFINVIYKSTFTITGKVGYFKILFDKINVTELVFKDFSDLAVLSMNFIRGNRPRRGFCVSSFGIVPQLGYEGFPSNTSQFITHQSTCFLTPCILLYWQRCNCYSSATDATTTATTTTTNTTTTNTTTTNNNNNNNGRDSVVGIVATGCTVRGSNPSRDEFSAPFQTCPGVHSAYYTMDPRSFSGVKWLGRALTTHSIKRRG
jgi:hypothetical protein